MAHWRTRTYHYSSSFIVLRDFVRLHRMEEELAREMRLLEQLEEKENEERRKREQALLDEAERRRKEEEERNRPVL